MARRNTQPPRNNTPDITMGRRADGSPWAIHIDFGATVGIDSVGCIRVDRKELSVEDVYERAQAMLAAVEWARSGRTAEIEAEAERELA